MRAQVERVSKKRGEVVYYNRKLSGELHFPSPCLSPFANKGGSGLTNQRGDWVNLTRRSTPMNRAAIGNRVPGVGHVPTFARWFLDWINRDLSRGSGKRITQFRPKYVDIHTYKRPRWFDCTASGIETRVIKVILHVEIYELIKIPLRMITQTIN